MKAMTFKTFRKYCKYHIEALESGHRHANSFHVYTGGFTNWSDGGECKEEKCKVWKRFKILTQ